MIYGKKRGQVWVQDSKEWLPHIREVMQQYLKKVGLIAYKFPQI